MWGGLMGWYGHPVSEAGKEAERKRLAEARQERAKREAKEKEEQANGAAYRKVVMWPKGLGGDGR
jgi:hypothetical protein